MVSTSLAKAASDEMSSQLVQLHVLVVGQLEDANGNLRKRRQAKMSPWRR
jgi:hypothetical protein